VKHIKKFEKFGSPSEEQLKEYNINVGDYVIANDEYYRFGPWFLDDLIQHEIGKVKSIFISNVGFQNESIFCEVEYNDIPRDIANHISGKPFIFRTSVDIEKLRKVPDEEYKEYKLKKDINKYNL